MFCSLIVVLASYWIFMSLISFYLVKKAIRKYKHYPLYQFQSQVKYSSFVRADYGKWDQPQLIKGCFFRSPIHFPLLLVSNAIYAILTTFNRYFKFPTVPMINFLRKTITKIAFRMCFEVVEEFNSNQQFTTPMVIANHSSQFDIFYIGSHLPLVSFLSKKDVQTTPIASSLAYFLKSLYVDRKDQQSRNKIKNDIINRVQEFKNNPNSTYPILIFPQGTTTNNKSIIQFKRGAFEPLCPVTILALNYQCKEFEITMDGVQIPYYQFLISCAKPKLTVMKDVLEPKLDESVQQFQERCRKRLGQMTGFQLNQADLKDFLLLQKLRKERRKIQQQKKKDS